MLKEYIAYIKDNPEGYWFKAKLFGWGWTPAKWQGWVTLLIFVGLIGFNAFLTTHDFLKEGISAGRLVIGTFLLLAIFLIICYKKGEKPRWRWGLPDKYKKL